jgi:N-acetyl-S-(2-succino)cysteine monooxygenase
LWDSWDDDAFIRDRATARYFDPKKLHYLRHKGEHFSVRGPLNVARPPQGRPVIFQAGSSEAGVELGARIAEAIFTPGLTLESSQKFYSDIKGRMSRYGRLPDDMKIMPGLNVIVGRTEAEAEEKHRYLQSLIHPDVGIELLQTALGNFNLRGYPIDGPLPEAAFHSEVKSGQTSARNVRNWARTEGLTIRQLYERFAGARGNRTLKGTPAQIADDMQTWFENRAVDGFLIQPPHLPAGLNEFVDLVIPELQSRGLFRTEYEGPTLRDNLGLRRPKSRYTANIQT